jgi:hypothetical protein
VGVTGPDIGADGLALARLAFVGGVFCGLLAGNAIWFAGTLGWLS